MLNQLKEGLSVYGLLDVVKVEPDLFKPVFVPREMFTVTSNEFLDELIVTYSEKQEEKHAEETTFKHFCGFVEHLHHVGKYNYAGYLQYIIIHFINITWQPFHCSTPPTWWRRPLRCHVKTNHKLSISNDVASLQIFHCVILIDLLIDIFI